MRVLTTLALVLVTFMSTVGAGFAQTNVATPASAPVADSPYASEEFGYIVDWPEPWVQQNHKIQTHPLGDVEIVLLEWLLIYRDGRSVEVIFVGMRAYDGNAEKCLADHERQRSEVQ